MKEDLNKQDQILETIGLKREMELAASSSADAVYDKSKFKNYLIPDKRSSHQKDMDHLYRMSDYNIIHIDSGLRLALTISEGYFGDETWKVTQMFIITSPGKKLYVIDADFEKEIFYTKDLEIPFEETKKL